MSSLEPQMCALILHWYFENKIMKWEFILAWMMVIVMNIINDKNEEEVT